jgi:hypothetical protein
MERAPWDVHHGVRGAVMDADKLAPRAPPV